MTNRTQCPDCRAATVEDVEEGYLLFYSMDDRSELADEDRAAIAARAERLLEEDRGIACPAHEEE